MTNPTRTSVTRTSVTRTSVTRTSVLPILITATLLVVTAGASFAEPTAPTSVAESTIVQGPSAEAARKAVEEVGGTVTHELGIIRAVGAALTAEQRAQIATSHPEIRMHADQEVRVESVIPEASTCGLSGLGARQLESNKLTWYVANPGSSDLVLQQVDVQWPAANSFIKKARFRGKDLFQGEAEAPSLTLTGPLRSNPAEVTLQPSKTEKLEIEFGDDLPDYNQANYQIALTFQRNYYSYGRRRTETCTAVFVPDELACRVAGSGERKLDSNKFEWDMVNIGTGPVSVQAVSISWPEQNGWIEKLKHDGHDIYTTEIQPPVATVVNDWQGSLSDRTLKANSASTLKLEFENDISLDQETYLVTVEFAEGCSTTFVPDTEALLGDATKGDKKARETVYPQIIRADELQDRGFAGQGVTIAVVDSGLWVKGRGQSHLLRSLSGQDRVLAVYDAIDDTVATDVKKTEDRFGHGSHVASIAASSRKTCGNSGFDGQYNGVAPDADLLIVKAFDDEGAGTYMDVIRGIQFVVDHRDTYGVRVMNLSFSGTPMSFYWDDPLNQAVMAAWQAGIVVVASAGNSGPDPMTVGVPGNVPYVITVGAMSDATTTGYDADDFLATFSSTGPTYEGFVKPEVIAPGGHLLGLIDGGSRLGKDKRIYHDGDGYFYMSGTSQAAAVVSGAAALLIETDPGLTPDEVKCRLMATARPAVSDGRLAYTVFQQGAGLIDVAAAAETTVAGCANQGLDIAADLAGEKHFGGRANIDGNGNYYLMDVQGDGYLWPGSYLWPRSTVWSDGYLWPRGYLWSNSLTETMSTNVWVPQE